MKLTQEQLNEQAIKFIPRGRLDFRCACESLAEVEETQLLYEIVKDFSDDVGIPFDKIDPCYVVYDYILQQARTAIQDGFTIDIQNDINYDTSGNYVATSYDRDADSERILTAEINKDKETRFELYSQNKYVAFFLDNVGLDDLFSNDDNANPTFVGILTTTAYA